ncbi:helix-turn-helix domain-containing protein [Streptomyces sp. NPDC090499]|uniref:helix-turn-helix domain-containing protein n=1 Tax=Streptomyces sp. NPDC090499 TaxID=3365965 RepID=UPI003809BCC4
MRELIARVEVVDDDTASALRVIAHFDHLVDGGVSRAATVRAAAALAGCPAGFLDVKTGKVCRYSADGRALDEDSHHEWPRTPLAGGHSGSGVWLERPGAARPLDSLILERWALSLAALSGHDRLGSTAEQVLVACSPDASEADRRDATRRLGLTGTVTVIAGPSHRLPSPWRTRLREHHITLVPGADVRLEGLRAGTSSTKDPMSLPLAAEQAIVALRTTDRLNGPGPSVVSYPDLGAAAAIAERFTAADAATVADVVRLEELRSTHDWVVDTLQAVLDQPSLRQAATTLHVHHSTLRERLVWLTHHLGYGPTHPGGRQRAALTVLLWRLADHPAAGDG